MSAPLFSIVEGTTKPLLFTLKSQGTTESSPQPFNLTGYLSIQIVLKNSEGTIVKDTSAGVSVTGTTAGQVQFSPGSSSGDLFVSSQSPYRVRWRVTDALSDVEFWPNDEEELIEVNPL
jgi:hypothetical protein